MCRGRFAFSVRHGEEQSVGREDGQALYKSVADLEAGRLRLVDKYEVVSYTANGKLLVRGMW